MYTQQNSFCSQSFTLENKETKTIKTSQQNRVLLKELIIQIKALHSIGQCRMDLQTFSLTCWLNFLLLLLSHFSRVRLCANPETAAYQAPLSLGFSRQEHWSGLPFPSPMHESEVSQSCLTLRDPMDCCLPGSSVHGIFQARVLEWGAIALVHSFSVLQRKDWQTFSVKGQTENILGFADYMAFVAISLCCGTEVDIKDTQQMRMTMFQ